MSNHPDKTTQARRLLKPHQVQQERLSSYMFLLKMYREGWQQAAPYLSRAYGALALFAGLGAGIGNRLIIIIVQPKERHTNSRSIFYPEQII
jgi:hypothetical protein